MSLSSRHYRRFERKLRKLRALLVHRALQHDRSAHDLAQSREDQTDDLAWYRTMETFAFGVVDRDHETLELIDEALERIENNEYGKCELCDFSISVSRLDALPYARHCIECANWIADHPSSPHERAG